MKKIVPEDVLTKGLIMVIIREMDMEMISTKEMTMEKETTGTIKR